MTITLLLLLKGWVQHPTPHTKDFYDKTEHQKSEPSEEEFGMGAATPPLAGSPRLGSQSQDHPYILGFLVEDLRMIMIYTQALMIMIYTL